MPVDSIDTAAVLRVLQPIWRDGVVASRLRNRIELIIDAARAAGHRSAENPARWRGHLDKLLPRPSKVRVVKHHASLPYRDVPVLMGQLRERDARSALALRFITLTAVRASECLGMTWGEVDLEQRLWTIPAARMKARREHRVPLADQAIELIKRMRHASVTGDARVFACALTALDRLRERMGMEETVHGLRSSFRVWCAECTSFPAEIAEQCLAHAVGDDTERAYQRSDVLEKRRQLMQEWADYCDRQSAEVVPLRAVS
jgi:integrase